MPTASTAGGMPIRQGVGLWIGDPVELGAFHQDLAAGEAGK